MTVADPEGVQGNRPSFFKYHMKMKFCFDFCYIYMDYVSTVQKDKCRCYRLREIYNSARKLEILFVCFVALRPKSTAMVIAGR